MATAEDFGDYLLKNEKITSEEYDKKQIEAKQILNKCDGILREENMVSIIMPSYNTASYIKESIQSVLNQTYTNWELIIVDDCSTDETEEVLATITDSRIKYFKNKENSGAAISRNKALREARGQWIAFLDSDDLWLPNKLEKQINFMKNNGYKFSYTNYEEIDMVTTPDGKPVAMVHCNNCTSDLNAWVGLFGEAMEAFGVKPDMDTLYGTLYRKALEGDADCGGLLAYNYFSGESITGFEEGRPLFVRRPDSKFSLANFMRVHLMTSLGALKVGMDILVKEEQVQIDKMLGHGGLFLTKGVGQRIMAAAMQTPVFVMETAGEGGAWGIAILASYMQQKAEGETLPEYLNAKVFHGEEGSVIQPDAADVEGFEQFMTDYKKGLAIERAAVEQLR